MSAGSWFSLGVISCLFVTAFCAWMSGGRH